MILVCKPVGVTPHQAINKLKEVMPGLSGKKLSYAGRLDPMAEGLLLILVDGENKKRRIYERMDKIYEFEILLGVSTDSYDILGLISSIGQKRKIRFAEIHDFVNRNTGNVRQKYPAYSAKKVLGKPLYYWARRGERIKEQFGEVRIRSLEFLGYRFMDRNCLEEKIIKSIKIVRGDFRNGEIVKRWRGYFRKNKEIKSYRALKFRISCSGGTYVRSLVGSFSKDFRTSALTLSIKRVGIGNLTVLDSITF